MAFTNSSVIVLNNTNTTHSFQTAQASPLSIALPAGSTDTWKFVVKRVGYEVSYGEFDATGGGIDSASIAEAQRIQATGTVLYTGSAQLLIDISFTDTQCSIEIGDGTVTPQEIVDAIENELVTVAGMRFLALNNGSQTTFAILGGQSYLLLGTAYRLVRRSTGDINATMAGFAISADGTPTDGINGSVAFLSAATLDVNAVAMAVWAYDISDNVTEGQAGKEVLDGVQIDTAAFVAAVRADMERVGGALGLIETKIEADVRQNLLVVEHDKTLAAIGALSIPTVDDVRTEVDAALVAYDGPTHLELTATVNGLSTLTAADVNAEVDVALSEYNVPTKAELDTAIASISTLSATEVRTEVDAGLAAYDAPTKAELDAGLAGLTIPDITTLETNIALILADTAELQTNQGNWVTATGFSTHSAADVWVNTTRLLSADSTIDAASISAITDAVQAGIVDEMDGSTVLDAIVQAIGNSNVDTIALVAAFRADIERAGGLLSTVQTSAIATTQYDELIVEHNATQTAIGLVATLTEAQVKAQVDQALIDYDPPTNTEMLTSVAGIPSITAAQVRSEVDASLINYDAPTKAELDAAIATISSITESQVLAQVVAALNNYDGPTKSELDAAIAAIPEGIDAPTVRAQADAALAAYDGSTQTDLDAAVSALSTLIAGSSSSLTAAQVATAVWAALAVDNMDIDTKGEELLKTLNKANLAAALSA